MTLQHWRPPQCLDRELSGWQMQAVVVEGERSDFVPVESSSARISSQAKSFPYLHQ